MADWEIEAVVEAEAATAGAEAKVANDLLLAGREASLSTTS